ncbi:MAG: hypothetical protein V2J25_17500 [Desulfatiglans sp.]|jgi:hypothetical protein|nr:hypothetical protein [Desulfatiglans sp.]
MKREAEIAKWEWMVKNTPQTEWINGKGVFLWLAFFVMEIGAGIYFVSLFVNFPKGQLTGWLLALALGGCFHMVFLGKKSRGWRILFRPVSSELSRGMWIMLLFALVGFFQLLPALFSGITWTGGSRILNVAMGILCILMMTHGFATMGVVRAVAIWNSSMMIPLSLASAVWVGSQAVVVMSYGFGIDITAAQLWAQWSIFCFAGVLAMFLWGALHSSETSKASIKMVLFGKLSIHFYVGVVAVGILIPMIITIAAWGNAGGWLLVLRLMCVCFGDLMMRYCVMKSPLYPPLI